MNATTTVTVTKDQSPEDLADLDRRARPSDSSIEITELSANELSGVGGGGLIAQW